MIRLIAVLVAVGVLAATASRAEVRPVSKEDEARWLRWLIPMPKRIAIGGSRTLLASDVGVRLRQGAGDVEQTAAGELAALFKEKAGAAPTGSQFLIFIGVCDPGGEREGAPVPGAGELGSLPNRDQAYRIAAVDNARLVLTALDEKGVYYAVRTLCQLLEGRFDGDRVTIPLADVLDWPDLEERGQWGGSAEKDVAWLASYKMNLVERHVTLKVEEDGAGVAETDTDAIEYGRRRAFKVVPIITHLDHLKATGLYDVYPELEGQGDRARDAAHPSLRAPCASNPKFFDVMADWMACLAEQRGVADVCGWLSEHHIRCGCDACREVGQYALEARALVQAWRQAREANPDLRLRILLTQGSYSTNDAVLAECPPEVGVTYYDGGRTYDSSRDPMIYPLLEEYAAAGRWLGCYPQLTASWRIVCPWSGPQFIQYRMQEFVDKKLRCLCGYATPDNRLYEFNILAAAEWAWNAHGRSPEDFALAWATRRGLRDPEAAARWAVTLGPVAWDVYGSGVPYPHLFGGAAGTIAGRKPLDWGEGPLRYFPDAGHLEKDLGVCEEAMGLARGLDEQDLVGETEVVQGYLRMLRALHRISEIHAGELGEDGRVLLGREVHDLAQATYDTREALVKWEQAAATRPYSRGRFSDTLNVTKQVALDVAKTLAAAGVEDPTPMLFGREVGRWVSDDFEASETVTKTIDVAEWIDGPGVYAVEFVQTGGYNGLRMHRVALEDHAVQPAKELAVDEHEGVAKTESEATEYVLKLDGYDASAQYALTARVTGVRSSDKPDDMRGCEGTISLRKAPGASED